MHERLSLHAQRIQSLVRIRGFDEETEGERSPGEERVPQRRRAARLTLRGGLAPRVRVMVDPWAG